jgi:ribonuclease HI
MLAVTIRCDGGAQPNPGPAGAGVVIVDDATGDTLATISEPLGVRTNNEAEYAALILGLEKALALGATRVTVLADSELVVRQMNGDYAVRKPHLRRSHLAAKELLKRFESWQMRHIEREKNTLADKLANEAIERARSGA